MGRLSENIMAIFGVKVNQQSTVEDRGVSSVPNGRFVIRNHMKIMPTLPFFYSV